MPRGGPIAVAATAKRRSAATQPLGHDQGLPFTPTRHDPNAGLVWFGRMLTELLRSFSIWPPSASEEPGANETPLTAPTTWHRTRQAFQQERLREPVPPAFADNFSMESCIEDAKNLLKDERIVRESLALICATHTNNRSCPLSRIAGTSALRGGALCDDRASILVLSLLHAVHPALTRTRPGA